MIVVEVGINGLVVLVEWFTPFYVKGGGGGGGGGVHPGYFVKLDFVIAVDQQTRARDRTFEGVPDYGCPRDSHAHIWSICGLIMPNDLNMLKTMIWGALLVATSLLDTCI